MWAAQQVCEMEFPAGAPARVGFDIDDTLLYSSPAFAVVKNAMPREQWFSDEFWSRANRLDPYLSPVKESVLELVRCFQARGVEIFAVTKRPQTREELLSEYMTHAFQIPQQNVLFRPAGKTQTLREYGIQYFFGDSDSDLTNAWDAGIPAFRILRSVYSNNPSDYNPGRISDPRGPYEAGVVGSDRTCLDPRSLCPGDAGP